MSDTSREAFEAWHLAGEVFTRQELGQICSPGSPREGEYHNRELEDQWQVWSASWQASRTAALEEAAKVCEDRRDMKEAELSRKRVDEAMKDKPDAALMHAMRHHTTVTLVNAELSRAAKTIRALAATPDTSIQPPSIDASSGRVDSIDAEG